MVEKIQQIINAHQGNKREDLIPILQEVQAHYNHLPEEAIYAISHELCIPASKVYSIATFYNLFRFQRIGKYHIRLCRGTACHLSKSSELLRELKKDLKIAPGQATPDGMFSIETVPCMGACHLSPIMRVNDKFYTRVETNHIKDILETYRNEES